MLSFIIKFNVFNLNILTHEIHLYKYTQLHNLFEIACVHKLAILSIEVIKSFNALSCELCVALCIY
jgi:hypothetical protein